MKRLEVFLYLLGGALFAAPALESLHWSEPVFCHGKDCPEFTVSEKNEHFEERDYNASRWMTTNATSSALTDLRIARDRLVNYYNGGNEEGTTVSTDTWPGLIAITEGEDGTEREVAVSWFVPPGTEVPQPSDRSVTVEDRPPLTVYVRVFHGYISHAHGQYEMEQLREDLKKAGKAFEPHRYTGAGYDSFFTILYRHNEIWIQAA